MRSCHILALANAVILLISFGNPATLSAAESPTLTIRGSAQRHGSFPRGAQRVEMLSLTLEASCADDVSIDSLTVRHRALGDPADILRVYALEGVRRVSRPVAFSNESVTLRFRGFVVPACQERTLRIAIDLSPNAASGSEHALTLDPAVDIDAGTADIKGDFISSGIPRIAPLAEGTVSVVYLDLPRALSYGARRTVSRIRLEAGGDRDQLVRAVTFTNDGSARDADLQNFFLTSSNGDVLSTVVSRMDGDTVRMELDPPLRLARGDERVLLLKADIRASRRRTVRFVIEEPSDVEAERATR